MKYSHQGNRTLSSISLVTGQGFKIDGNVYVVRRSLPPFPVVCQKLPCFEPFDAKNPEKYYSLYYISLPLFTKIDEDEIL